MALFFDKFSGFGPQDFAAFEERKWQSNRFNLERMRVREKLEALGKAIAGPVMQQTPGMKWGVTDHVPSLFNQRTVKEIALYFTRNDEQQRVVAPYVDSRVALPEQVKDAGEFFRNLSLYVGIDNHGIQVGLKCHSTAYVDVMNLVNRLQKPEEMEIFTGLLGKIEPSMKVRLTPEQETTVANIKPSDWQELGDKALQSNFFIALFREFEPTDPVIQKPAFQDEILNLLLPLRDLFVFWLWSGSNDHLGLAREMKAKREIRAGAVPTVSVGAWVRVMSGLFRGRKGKVLELDRKGVVKVKIGKVMVRLSTDEIRVLPPRR